jgi:nitrate reductase gamma subunit
MSGLILVVSYALVALFLVGFVVRTVRLARMPVHLRWELAPIPHEKGKGQYGGSYLEEVDWWTKPREKSLVAEVKYMLLEIVFLKAVWEHNRSLWWFSFPFHAGLYALAVAAAGLIAAGVGGVLGIGAADAPALRTACTVVATAGYVLGAIGAVGLLAKRAFDQRMRGFTSPAAVFNVALLLAVFVSGLAAVAATDYFGGVTAFVAALGRADGAAVVPGLVTLHMGLTLVFLAYLPLTKMMHFVAKYFTYHEVRWNDEPMTTGGTMEREVQELLSQPVTWAGPHVHADGKKTWVDIATEEVAK